MTPDEYAELNALADKPHMDGRCIDVADLRAVLDRHKPEPAEETNAATGSATGNAACREPAAVKDMHNYGSREPAAEDGEGCVPCEWCGADQRRGWCRRHDKELAARDARIKAEAWDECARQTHNLGWLHDWALSDALARNPYRIAREVGE